MIKNLPTKIHLAFQDNLKDWCLGGPKKEGWTRRGWPVPFPAVKLVDYHLEDLSVDDGLAKNRAETKRWHIDFLEALVALGKTKFYWKNTLYYWEYLKPRYDDKVGYARAQSFINLFEDILDNGVRRAILVADLEEIDKRLKYFRFDGCHRLCCAKYLGVESIPALVFRAERCGQNDLSALHIAPSKHGSQNIVGSSFQRRHLL